jgi:hypothetical protein
MLSSFSVPPAEPEEFSLFAWLLPVESGDELQPASALIINPALKDQQSGIFMWFPWGFGKLKVCFLFCLSAGTHSSTIKN